MPKLGSIGIIDETKPKPTSQTCTIRDSIIEEIQVLKKDLSDVAINEATRAYHLYVIELKKTIKLSALKEDYLPTQFRDLLVDQYYNDPKNF